MLPQVDEWLSAIFDPQHIDQTCKAIVGAVDPAASIGERAKATATTRECDRKLDRYRALLDAGTEAALVAGWIAEVQAERQRAVAVAEASTRDVIDATTTEAEIRQTVEELGGLVGLLQVSEPQLRTRFYEEVGFTGTYDPASRSVEALADIGVRNVRVGGGTWTINPRQPLAGCYLAVA